jgi:hypothetical protein
MTAEDIAHFEQALAAWGGAFGKLTELFAETLR